MMKTPSNIFVVSVILLFGFIIGIMFQDFMGDDTVRIAILETTIKSLKQDKAAYASQINAAYRTAFKIDRAFEVQYYFQNSPQRSGCDTVWATFEQKCTISNEALCDSLFKLQKMLRLD
jgi:hypothetical protein